MTAGRKGGARRRRDHALNWVRTESRWHRFVPTGAGGVGGGVPAGGVQMLGPDRVAMARLSCQPLGGVRGLRGVRGGRGLRGVRGRARRWCSAAYT
jgi:hypothetical protein